MALQGLSGDLERGAKQRRLVHHGAKQCAASADESEVIEAEMPASALVALLGFSSRPSMGSGFRKIGGAHFESIARKQPDAAGAIRVEAKSHFTCADFQFGHELGITEELFNNGSQERLNMKQNSVSQLLAERVYVSMILEVSDRIAQ
jgi:hypothetical protein